MKKCMLVTLVMAFLMVMASSYCSAQVTGVADTSKEGSLLIWPKVQTNDGNETYIIIVNDTTRPVDVKCYWEVKDVPTNQTSTCLLSDFVIQLTKNDPVVFKASDGTGLGGDGVAAGMGTGEKGALKCWAVDASDSKQISWNHLGGFALIVNTTTALPGTSVMEYSAWRFAANVVDNTDPLNRHFADGYWVGLTTDDVDTLALGGTPTITYIQNQNVSTSPFYCRSPYTRATCSLPSAVYDACPVYLTFDFLAEPNSVPGFAINDLSLVPCKEDFTGGPSTQTDLVFTIWNENEVKFTGMYACANCVYEAYLGKLLVGRTNRTFTVSNLHTSSGRFRVDGLKGTKCPGSDKTSLVGVMATRLTAGPGSTDLVATNGTGSGKQNADPGYIMWTPGGAYQEKPSR